MDIVSQEQSAVWQIFERPTYYRDGNIISTGVIGYESGKNRVVRFSFTTGEHGATRVSFITMPGTIRTASGTPITKIPFYITTSETSHANANNSDDWVLPTGYITGDGSSNGVFSGAADIVLKESTTYYVWFFPDSKTFGYSYWHNLYSDAKYYTQYTLSGKSNHELSISAGQGSSVKVSRTSSSVGSNTGVLSDGDVIYINDQIKIEFAPDANYKLLTTYVNGVGFASGSTHTVTGDVSVTSTAQVLASDVGATDANIGSASTIIVTKYNPGYYHTLQYKFGNLSGHITSSGGVSPNEFRFSESSVAFSIPTDFYSEIPSEKSGICTIICRTYSDESSDEQLGYETSCQFIVTASEDLCRPIVAGTVRDENQKTVSLTGDDRILVRYMSTAVAEISAVAKNDASISSAFINGEDVSNTDNMRKFEEINSTSFVFEATDSRGYSSSDTVTTKMVPYTKLTLNPTIRRPNATGGELNLSISGNFYSGSFRDDGSVNNTLTILYRYRSETEATYSDEMPIQIDKIVIKDGHTYSVDISLEGFDYRNSYIFEIKAVDGTSDCPLSVVTREVTVQRGIPIFDWGENDFNFNVSVKISENGSLTIGDTTVTEEQLKSLLALIT